jgi:transposase
MLAITKSQRYFIYARSADMRRGFDSLCGMVRDEFLQNPLSGDVFVFLSKRKDKIKLLQWQGDGFAIFSKRLEKGTYEIPKTDLKNASEEITPQQLLLIMEGIQLLSVKKRVRYENYFVNNFSKQNVQSASA